MLPRTEQETLCVQKRVSGEISEILRPFVFLPPNQRVSFLHEKFPELQVGRLDVTTAFHAPSAR